MMRLDLNVDLGLRILLLLTWHEDEGPLGTSAIAEAEGLDASCVQSLLENLEIAGFVEWAKEGSLWRLSRASSEITVCEVLESLANPASPFLRSPDPQAQSVGRSETELRVAELMNHVESSVRSTLRWIALDDLAGQTPWLDNGLLSHKIAEAL